MKKDAQTPIIEKDQKKKICKVTQQRVEINDQLQ